MGKELCGRESMPSGAGIVQRLSERHRAGTRPAPTGVRGVCWRRGHVREYMGRHKACPYGRLRCKMGRRACAGVPGQAQGLPLREVEVQDGEEGL